MLELKVDFISTEELADWAGKKCTTSFKHNKNRWCKSTLSKYAEYESVHGGVNITKVKQPIYKSSAYLEVKEKLLDNWGYDGLLIDSCSNCYYKIKPTMINKVKDKTGKDYVSKAKCEQFGVAYKNKKRSGTKGTCRYVFCKTPGIPFTQEELEIKARLEQEYLKSDVRQMYMLQELRQSFKEGEITDEEYQEEMDFILNNAMGWILFIDALQEELNCKVGFFQELEPTAWEVMPNNNTYEF